MTNPHPYRIPADKRGHRKPLVEGKKSLTYQVRLSEDIYTRARSAGPVRVRRAIEGIDCGVGSDGVYRLRDDMPATQALGTTMQSGRKIKREIDHNNPK